MLLFVTFMQRGGKEIGFSVYFDSRKSTPKHLYTHTWRMEATEPGTSCVLSPMQASAPRNARIQLHQAARCNPNTTYCRAFGTRGAFHKHTLNKRKV